jgi:hypothetical protein
MEIYWKILKLFVCKNGPKQFKNLHVLVWNFLNVKILRFSGEKTRESPSSQSAFMFTKIDGFLTRVKNAKKKYEKIVKPEFRFYENVVSCRVLQLLPVLDHRLDRLDLSAVAVPGHHLHNCLI